MNHNFRYFSYYMYLLEYVNTAFSLVEGISQDESNKLEHKMYIFKRPLCHSDDSSHVKHAQFLLCFISFWNKNNKIHHEP